MTGQPKAFPAQTQHADPYDPAFVIRLICLCAFWIFSIIVAAHVLENQASQTFEKTLAGVLIFLTFVHYIISLAGNNTNQEKPNNNSKLISSETSNA